MAEVVKLGDGRWSVRVGKIRSQGGPLRGRWVLTAEITDGLARELERMLSTLEDGRERVPQTLLDRD